MKKEFEEIKDVLKVNIPIDWLRVTFKKISNWKALVYHIEPGQAVKIGNAPV